MTDEFKKKDMSSDKVYLQIKILDSSFNPEAPTDLKEI
jgi:hypothetical protein